MSKNSKSVLIIANYINGKGGIANIVNSHYKKLQENGFKIELFNTKKNNFIRLILLPALLFKVKSYNNIHIHCCSFLGFYPAFIGVIAGRLVPNRNIIVTYHGGGAERFLKNYHYFIKYIICKADSITVMSPFLKQTFLKYGIETHMVRNVINIQIKKDRTTDFNVAKIASIRNLSKNYNIDDICEAFILIKKKHPKASLNIAGDGDEKNKLYYHYNKIKNINFLGQLPYNDVPELLISNNIFISVPTFDNQPLSILEAMASGTIVISSKVGGVIDMIEDGMTGLFVDVNQPEEIAEKIEWVINNPIKARRIIQNAYKEVEKYSWKEVGAKLTKLYN